MTSLRAFAFRTTDCVEYLRVAPMIKQSPISFVYDPLVLFPDSLESVVRVSFTAFDSFGNYRLIPRREEREHVSAPISLV